MNADLKGRIIRVGGAPYLVLQDNEKSAEWLEVKSIGPKPRIQRMRREEIMHCLSEFKGP
jgi:hypothetical protein